MTSLQMRALAVFLRLTAKPSMTNADRARRRLAAAKKPSPPPAALVKRHDVTTREVAGFLCHTVAPRGRPAKRAALYIHGGAYVYGFARQHWALISRLADAGVRVEAPDYGLAPQHTHEHAYPFLTEVYRQLLAEVDASAVTVAGDSAGGGLALGFAQTLADVGLPQPMQLVLISPWLDLTLSHPGIEAAEARDPWLSSVGLVEAGRAWAGKDEPADHRLSPINGPLSGLARMHAYIGTRDLFYPDVLRLRELAADAGARLDVTVCDGAIHVYPLVSAPEGRAAARTIVEQLSR